MNKYIHVDRFFGWKTFRFKGVSFLALDRVGSFHIINSDLDNYGAFGTIKSFKQMYEQKGEALNLTAEKARGDA